MQPELLVLKLGGSLLATGRMGPLIELVRKAKRPVVIVPGGGAFADQVRQSQKAHGFDDATAHRLALFAMHQMANVIASRAPHVMTAATPQDMAAAGAHGAVPVWVPSAMVAADPEIPKSWDMTSDSLAAWLAARLGTPHVALVKSCAVDPDEPLAGLTAAGIVDPLFGGYAERHGLNWSVIGADDEARLARLLGIPEPASSDAR